MLNVLPTKSKMPVCSLQNLHVKIHLALPRTATRRCFNVELSSKKVCDVAIHLKADFHSAENIARSTFSAHFLLNCSNQIQISEHISKESEREKSIARHFPLNGNPP